LDLECLTLLRRLPISHSTLSETARHINECNRLKYMNAQIDYLAYIADKKKPTCPKATRSPMDMLCHAHPFPEYGSPDYFKHEVSANYLANCYVADFARREAWQAQRDATIHGHFGRVDYAKKILSSSENPFVASWAYMNEYNQIGFHAFVEDVSHSELEPAVDHLAKRFDWLGIDKELVNWPRIWRRAQWCPMFLFLIGKPLTRTSPSHHRA